MEKERFVNDIKDWLYDSGAIRDLQTRLRKELIESIASKGPQKEWKRPSPSKGKESDPAFNMLIMEHLMTRGLWYTASVMAKEAVFLPDLPPPQVGYISPVVFLNNCN